MGYGPPVPCWRQGASRGLCPSRPGHGPSDLLVVMAGQEGSGRHGEAGQALSGKPLSVRSHLSECTGARPT